MIMKKNIIQLSIVCIIATLMAFTCKKEDTANNKCLSFAKAPVTAVTGPATGSINQDINLTVSFACSNGCGQFGSFEQARTGNTFEISVTAKYEGCVCTQDIPVRQQTYTFRASQPGTYLLNFVQQNNTFVTHTIVVQ
jgi:hypothetical protein